LRGSTPTDRAMKEQYDRTMSPRGSLLAAAMVTSLLAACSSGGDASPETTTTTPTVTATTEAEPTTTDAPTTTEAPTTTTIDAAQVLAAEVEADLLEAFRLGREASQDPFNASKEQAALERRLGAIADGLQGSLAEFRERNYAIRPNYITPASVVVESAPRFLGSDGEVAQVQICEVNSWILVEIGAGPNGTDAIVNPDVVASRATIFMRDVDGIWLFEGSSLIEEWEGVAECVAE